MAKRKQTLTIAERNIYKFRDDGDYPTLWEAVLDYVEKYDIDEEEFFSTNKFTDVFRAQIKHDIAGYNLISKDEDTGNKEIDF